MKYDIYLVGVGGQGVLTIAEILSEAVAEAGLPVTYYPHKGMAQRGGFVKAQVRIGRDVVGPNIPERGADLVIAMERSEALRAVRFIKPGQEFLLFDNVWAPTAVMLGKAEYPSLEQVRDEVCAAGGRFYHASPASLPTYNGQPVSDNTYVLGLAAGHTRLRELLDPFNVAELVKNRWPKAAERNLCAFQAGLDACTEEISGESQQREHI